MTPAQAEAAAAVSILTQRGLELPARNEFERALGLTRLQAESAMLEGWRRGLAKSMAGIHAMPVVGDGCGEYR